MLKHKSDVVFTFAQLRFLEELFPNAVLGPHASEAAMRYYFGSQAVVQAVRERTRGLNATKSGSPTGDIPTPIG